VLRTQRIVASHFSFLNGRVIATLVLSIILCACGGGGGGDSAASTQSNTLAGNANPTAHTPSANDAPSAETPAEQASTQKPVQALTIDYYGDSTIWGYGSGSGTRVATPAPATFAAALPNSARHTVRNEGVNASDACQLLNGHDGKHPAWDTQMASSNADVVIINHAINDQWRMDVGTYKSCLTSLAVKAEAHGKKVIFETPNPTRDAGANSLGVYVNAMKAVAAQQGAPVIDQYNYLLSYLNGQSPYTICPDGLHPSDAVYAMKGKYAASSFAAIMGL
jgi:lysophospholipase L1-like esterase